MNDLTLVGYQYIFASVLCTLLLTYIAFTYKNISDMYSYDRYIFYSVVFAAISAGGDMIQGINAYITNFDNFSSYLWMIVYSIGAMLSLVYWLLYSEGKQETRSEIPRIERVAILLPFVICGLFIITTPFTHLYFYYDDSVFYEGPFFHIISICIFIFGLWSGFRAFFRSFQKEYYLKKSDFRLLFHYTFCLLIVQLIQTFLPTFIPYRSVGNMVLFLVTLLQTMRKQIRVDSLCKINNRFAFDHCISYKMDNHDDFALAILDVDKFKSINDKHGHKAGDQALIVVAKAIIKSVPREVFVSRYGGDEFALVGPNNPDLYQNLEEKINDNIKKLANDKDLGFTFTCSLGYTLKNDSITNIPDFIQLADQELYKRKNQKNNIK